MKLAQGWQIKNLADLAQIQTGAMVNANQTLRNPVQVPYMRVANVQDAWLDLTEVEQISIEQESLSRHCLQAGDVLLAMGGDADKVGRAALWRGQITPCIHQNHILVLRSNPALLLAQYLNTLIGSSYGKTYFRRSANQSTNLATLTAGLVREFPVLLPPLVEQERILQMLGDFDQAIAGAEAILANSALQKQAYLEQAFSAQFSFSGKPAQWRTARLAEVTDFAETALGKGVADDFSFRYIEIADVKGGRIADELAEFTKATAPARARRLVREGSVLLAMVRPNLKRYARAYAQHEGCIASSGFAVLQPCAAISSDFLYYSLYSEAMQQQLKLGEKGSNYPQLNLEDVKNLVLRYPLMEEQAAICEILSLLDQRLQLETRQLHLLRQARAEMFERVLQRACIVS